MSGNREKITTKVESLGGHIRVKADISIDKRLITHYRVASQNRAAEECSDLLKDAVQAALGELHERFEKSGARKVARANAAELKGREARAGIDHAANSGRVTDDSVDGMAPRGERNEGEVGYLRDDEGKPKRDEDGAVMMAGSAGVGGSGTLSTDDPGVIEVGSAVVFDYEGQDVVGEVTSVQGGVADVTAGESEYSVLVGDLKLADLEG